MDEKNSPIVCISGVDERKLGAALIAVQSAFSVAIAELSKLHKGNSPQWFEDLEEVVIANAKGTVTEGISLDVEVESLKFGIDVLRAILDVSRVELGFAAKE
ncbi:hypothetical protein PYR71_29895 [Rhizobium sp. MC63]|jgi:hypothetical protein|uniref:Uncharacterized protein n=16 Tax=Rhizobium TaxID=379 RepID=A0A1C3YCI0_9HYPH|nr:MULTISPECIES: hypothetical protein [Rhizobium]ACE93919.1 hypothetical protein RHECIAT_PB0000208 [Rhizobium etli CIAT 652]AJC82348.1 hypothetical protein IE4803_PB00295 [Rhizobium etli bv. phaseoli str. IE4803]EGE55325.1 hypothetical protein RHECNPAF_9520011 [Rhizobium etli CNPAF512]KEC69625.1 hypothetical protein RLPCCGM1_p1817 [Rhizobium leguminosarum bv. phaseoli CCGM1]ANK88450.1 hypothetical protein AMK02_PC00213 [Rhizobium sp. N731]